MVELGFVNGMFENAVGLGQATYTETRGLFRVILDNRIKVA